MTQEVRASEENPIPSIAQRLPFDLLEVIFTRCLPTGEGVMYRPDPREAPLILCHICGWWRSVGLSIASLWKELYIKPYHSRDKETGAVLIPRPAIDLIRQWWGCTGSIPLRCRLEFGYQLDAHDFRLDPPRELELIDISLIQSLQRLQRIELISELPGDPPINALSGCEEGFPNLESILLWANKCGQPGDYPLVPLRRAPRLRKVILHNYLQLYPDIATFLPWSQLTHLVSECFITGSIWHQVLEQCVNLKAGMFYLLGAGWFAFDIADSYSIVVSSLEHLTLFLLSPITPVENLYKGLYFPSLKTSQISSHREYHNVMNWEMIASKTPSLTELYIGPKINFSELELYSSLNRLVPRLETLIIDQALDFEFQVFTTQSLAGFVKDRRTTRGLSSIRRLVLILPHPGQIPVDPVSDTTPEEFMDEIQVAMQASVGHGLDLIVRADGRPYREIPYPDPFGHWYEGIQNNMLWDYDIYRA